MKTLVIDAIIGVGFEGSLIIAEECVKAGLARRAYAGPNRPLPEFVWDRRALEAVDLEKLQLLYQGMREARDEAVAREKAAEAVKSKIIVPENPFMQEAAHAD